MVNAFQNIDVDQLSEMIESEGSSLIVLDVREPWEFEQGHVPNAVLIPLGDLPERVFELDQTQSVAVICEHGVRSLYAAAFLKRAGFDMTYNVEGGTSAWVERGLPVE